MRHHVDRELARARTHGASAAGGSVTDVPATVDRLLGLMRRMPRADVLTYDHDLPAGLRLRMDPDDFGEIMGNLLDNARRWAAGRVAVRADLAQGRVTLHIDDDGPGIRPEHPPARGHTGPPPGARGDEGHGLGLAIVGDILGQYDTALSLGTSPQGGCRASFTLAGWCGA
jgi:signal transduction histidine kinase